VARRERQLSALDISLTRGLTRGLLVTGLSGGVSGSVPDRDFVAGGGVAGIPVHNGAERRLVPVRRQPVAVHILVRLALRVLAGRRGPPADVGVASSTAARGNEGPGASGDGAAAPVATAA